MSGELSSSALGFRSAVHSGSALATAGGRTPHYGSAPFCLRSMNPPATPPNLPVNTVA